MLRPMAMMVLIFLINAGAKAETDFWEAVHNLEMDSIQSTDIDDDQSSFIAGLQKVMDGDFHSARTTFSQLSLNAPDTVLSKYSLEVLASLLTYQAQWDSLAKVLERCEDTTNIASIVRGYSQLSKEVYSFPQSEQKIPMDLSLSGTPIVEVRVNGQIHRFWLDTGAGLTVISSDVASQCGLTPLGNENAKALTGTTRMVGITPTVIEELQIAELELRNHPAIIIDSRDLQFKFLGMTVMEIEGIIGWNAIQNMDLEIDYGEEYIVIREPVKRDVPDRNFFWLDFPIVKASTPDGVPLYFFLDTGSNKTGIYKNIFTKIDPGKVSAKKTIIGSAGGMEMFEVSKISRLEMIVDDDHLTLKNVTSFPQRELGFVTLDGILGADALKHKRVRIDITSGVLDIVSDRK